MKLAHSSKGECEWELLPKHQTVKKKDKKGVVRVHNSMYDCRLPEAYDEQELQEVREQGEFPATAVDGETIEECPFCSSAAVSQQRMARFKLEVNTDSGVVEKHGREYFCSDCKKASYLLVE